MREDSHLDRTGLVGEDRHMAGKMNGRVPMAAWLAALAGVIALALTLAPEAHATSFKTTSYPLSPAPGQSTETAESLAVVDLNGDQKPDIAELDSLPQSNRVSVFINQGQGAFAAAVQHPTGCSGGATNLIAGKFDGDSHPDLLIACPPDAIELPGNGSGGFGAPITYTHLSVAGPMTVGPFDRNGHTDLGYDALGGHVFCYIPVVLLSTASDPSPIYPTCDSHPMDSAALVMAKLDEHGDNTPRALAFSHGTGPQTLQVRADTDATCCAESDRAVGGPGNAIAVGDLNGDGDSDVVMGNGSSPDGSVSVYLWDPGAGIVPSATPKTYDSIVVERVVIGDFNRDGSADVAAGGYDPTTSAGEVAIHSGSATGSLSAHPKTFAVPSFRATEFGGTDLATADLNGDHVPDLVAAYDNQGGSAGVSVLLNTTPAASFKGVGLTAGSLAVDKHGKLAVPVSCPTAAAGKCAGKLTIKTKGKFSHAHVVKVGTAAFSITAGRSKHVTVKVSSAARSLLKHQDPLPCKETALARDSKGKRKKTSVTVKLKASG
jgi:hypothetical protein